MKLPALLCSILLVFCNTARGINIIFDLGDVLFETDTLSAFNEVGMSRFVYYSATHPHKLPSLSSHLRQRLFTVLNNALPREADEAPAHAEQGILMPQILCNWLKGISTSAQVLAILKRTLNEHPDYCDGVTERNLIRATIKMMFTPHRFAKTRRMITDMAAFARECHQHGHALYILSNWDTETFALIKTMHSDFFALFTGIVLSGDCHAIKPDAKPYRYLLDTYHLDPAECVFIDDRPENIATAQQLGIHGIVCTRRYSAWYSCHKTSNVKSIRKQLQAFILAQAHHPSAVTA